MTAFFDTSALMALVDQDYVFHAWSLDKFTELQELGPILINDVVYAEFSVAMATRSEVDQVINRLGLQRILRDDDALFDAGKRFHLYKDKGGPKMNVLADFFIGAAARSLEVPLVTSNPKDFRSFFSGLTIIHPKGEEIVG